MTCVDKLRLIHTDWTNEQIEEVTSWDCPSDYGILADPVTCMNGAVDECVNCWARNAMEDNK